jgi:hypothetical protein
MKTRHDPVFDPERSRDVLDDGRGRGRREGKDPFGAEIARDLRKPKQFGPEVRAPGAHRVRLVNGEKRNPHPTHRAPKAVGRAPLRRHVEKLDGAGPDGGKDLRDLAPRHRRVDPRRGDPLRPARVRLVLHQRQQRRDDDRGSLEVQGGQLVTERLSTAGWQQREHGATIGEQSNDGELLWPE